MSKIIEGLKIKLRFTTPKGNMSIEQLLSLPLESTVKSEVTLQSIAKTVTADMGVETNDSLLSCFETSTVDEKTQLRYDILKEIIQIKIADKKIKTATAIRQSQINEIDALIAAKETEKKSKLSLDELRAMRRQIQTKEKYNVRK